MDRYSRLIDRRAGELEALSSDLRWNRLVALPGLDRATSFQLLRSGTADARTRRAGQVLGVRLEKLRGAAAAFDELRILPSLIQARGRGCAGARSTHTESFPLPRPVRGLALLGP
jgi:hypothetical protein